MDGPIKRICHFDATFSKSEKRGLSLLGPKDLRLFCPGISTCGVAEIRMALGNPSREIIATTIDGQGYSETKNVIERAGLSRQITVKLEDLREPFPYMADYFDFIYARLVLHYLTNKELKFVLGEFYRVLKNGGRIFIVVRSVNDWETRLGGATSNERTGMTTYPLLDTKMKPTGETRTRHFHSMDSISAFLKVAGFKIKTTKEYQEQLFQDYMRTSKTPQLSSLIEILAVK